MFGLSPLPRTSAAALRDIEHKKFEVRLSAVRDLGRLARGPDRLSAIGALVRALREDVAAGVRAEAAVALADAEATQSVDHLIAALHDDHLRVRQMALVALGELGAPADDRLRDIVVTCLRDEAPEIRYQSVIALARLFPERLEAAVIRLLGDRDEHIRYVAIRTAEERWVTDAADFGRVEVPSAIFAAISAVLRDASAEVRLAGAIFLARSGNRSGVDQIVRALNAPHAIKELEDEQAAVELAGELALAPAKPGLERRAWGLFGLYREPCAWHARVALARMGDARAKTSIIRGLSAWTRDARSSAVAAAGQARLYEARALILTFRGNENKADQQAVEHALALLSSKAVEVEARS